MVPPQGPTHPARPPYPGGPEAGRAEALGSQAAAAARAAAGFYRGWRTGRAPAPNPMEVGRSRAAERHQIALSGYRSKLAALRVRLLAAGAGVIGGAAVAASSLDGMPTEAPLAVLGGSAVVIGAWQAIASRNQLRTLEQPAAPPPVVLPPPGLPPGSPGAASAERVTGLRMHIIELLPAVEQLQPRAADQIRAADAATPPGMHALVERIRSMRRIIREMPGSTAAQSAQITINALLVRLNEGASAYQELLAAVIDLSSAPALSGGPAATLRPAIQDMHAYAAGLQRAAETWQ